MLPRRTPIASPRGLCATGVVGIALLIGDGLVAQVAWRDRSPYPAGFGSIDYDADRGVTVLFGGSSNRPMWFADTWEWDGRAWTRRYPQQSPPMRSGHVMVYDSARHRTMLFGGNASGAYDTGTWEYDGTRWQLRTPTVSPIARNGHAMAYDSARGVTVLFGGASFGNHYADTWEWNGADWLQRATTRQPTARSGAAMCFDVVRTRTVLFGGADVNNRDDTWLWDGANWTLLALASHPSARSGSGIAYDTARGRAILFGGSGFGGLQRDTWEWDGARWQTASPAVGPDLVGPLAYDARRGRIVMYGGNFLLNLEQTWEWDGTAWTEHTPDVGAPGKVDHALAYDLLRGRTVLFGGGNGNLYATSADTWEWDGVAWSALTPPLSPPARASCAMSFDAVNQSTLLFGGGFANSTTAFGDTWLWDGAAWLQRFPATSPPARSGHALATDLARAEVVLFGGIANFQLLDDTWVWNGSDWLQRQPSTRPSPRSGAAMTYDLEHGNVVQFGGFTGVPANAPRRADTFEWDGSDWHLRSPLHAPPPRDAAALVYDVARQRSVLFGGDFGGSPGDDTWEWDGVDWTRLDLAVHPALRRRHALAYDWARECTVLFGGTFIGGNYPYPHVDTWELGANRDIVGPGCPGSRGVPLLDTTDVLRIGGTFTTSLTNLAANAAIAAVVTGTSATAWAGGSLPQDLTSLGLTGCSMRVRPDVVDVRPVLSGSATLAIDVPVAPSLIGRTLFQQGLSLDHGINAAGMVLSNAITATIGR